MPKLKPETRHPTPKIIIVSRDDADRALKTIGVLEDDLAARTIDLNERIARLKEKYLMCGGMPIKKTVARWLAALEKWATKNKDEFPEDSKTLALNFGKVWFKWTPWRIEFDVEEETVIERLRARKMDSCIRVIAEVNKEALEAYDDATLKKLGCRRERDDKFYYEVKREEVK